MFKEKMVTTAIPERVFALCKIVEKGSIYSGELKNKMEPEFLGNGSVYFNDYKNAAEELGLVTISDDLISLAVDPKIVKSIESMRTYINWSCIIQDNSIWLQKHISIRKMTFLRKIRTLQI